MPGSLIAAARRGDAHFAPECLILRAKPLALRGPFP